MRGQFPEYDAGGDVGYYGPDDEDTGHEAPPSPVGQDERRMQVRAYNYWAGMLDNRTFPSIEDLDPENLPDFGPHSVLLDFTGGIENPGVTFLGGTLAEECAGTGIIRTLADVPSRSLLSRITDHYMQILANQAPIGFEAEFVNQRGATVLYRGILLPFSSDDETIDFIYGVINWKELADQQTTDELLLEIDQALEAQALEAQAGPARETQPITDWADGPADTGMARLTSSHTTGSHHAGSLRPGKTVLDLRTPLADDDDGNRDAATLNDGDWRDAGWPEPAFGRDEDTALPAPAFITPLDDDIAFAEPYAPDAYLPDVHSPDAMELADWLASARELAQAAKGSEDRSRSALYAAIGRAYDFSLAATDAPDDFQELVADSGLTMQDRAPMTPVVKLVFGADYDKTRITEYASALNHAHRLRLPRGSLTDYLISAPGGLKGVVTAERQLRREESGKSIDPRETPREALARKLRKLDTFPLDAVAAEGSEFTLLVARRLADGTVVLLGEICDDIALLERAAKKLLG